ncbi:helix-turn-helix domain-containing protein [Catenulispora sp. GAS73]|uniref:helix-turn-helix domain-containing protein n=1 Tax=Catenulispora sp. GAS73 TaxID=3156269 RepID=UPI00351633C0
MPSDPSDPSDPQETDGSHFGVALRRLRVAGMMSQEQLAQRAGLSVRAVRDMERGRVTRPRGDSIRLLAEALGLDPAARTEFVRASTRPAGPGPAGTIPVVAQLPLDVPCFAGRRPELAWLNAQIAEVRRNVEAVTVLSLSGVAGGGKSALAVHWAHTVRNQFPDGQLYVDMRETDTGRKPVMRSLTDVVTALGPAPEDLPNTLDALIGTYRTLMADRRMLVVLDNVDDSDQVRPLLPGAAGSVVVVTSRGPLVGLVAAEGAQPLTIGLPSWPDARELLARRIGADRVRAEPEAAEEIIGRCARLPLALAVIAARAAVRPEAPLRTLAAELDGSVGLHAFTVDDASTDIRGTFRSALRSLPRDAVRLFRLLGRSGTGHLTVDAAAEQTGMSSSRIRGAFDALVREHIMAESDPGRFGSHALLLAYARELSAGT